MEFSHLFLDVKPDKIVELNITQDSDNLTFPTKDVFVNAACHIARGGTLEVIGTPKPTFSVERSSFKATFDNNSSEEALYMLIPMEMLSLTLRKICSNKW